MRSKLYPTTSHKESKETFLIDLGLPGDLNGVHIQPSHRSTGDSVYKVPSEMINIIT